MDNIEQLQSIGLNDREAKVYLATLELGESTVLPISKKSDIKRTYCYDILGHLIDKNLVSYYEKNHRRRYVAEDPQKITKILENRLDNFNTILPDLKTIYNKSVIKPKIRFFEGAEGVKEIYQEILQVTEIMAISSPDHIVNRLGDFIEKLADRVFAKNIQVREIMVQGVAQAEYYKKFVKPLQEARLLPEGVKIETDLIIYGQKLAMISYKSDIHAVVIESSSIVETQKMMFEIIWQASEQINA